MKAGLPRTWRPPRLDVRRQTLHRKIGLPLLATREAHGAVQALAQRDLGALPHLPLPHLALAHGGAGRVQRDGALAQHLQSRKAGWTASAS